MQDPAGRGIFRSNRIRLLYLAFAVQALGALFFVGDLWSDILGLRSDPIPWMWQEYIQIFASAGLIVGVVVSGAFLRMSLRHISRMGRQMDVVSGNFQTHVLAQFGEWNFSPSEQAVAIYAMKGFSNNEIAALRGTSTATIKSQMNSIFRKSGLASRQQLISFLVEELLAGIPLNDGAPAAVELNNLHREAVESGSV